MAFRLEIATFMLGLVRVSSSLILRNKLYKGIFNKKKNTKQITEENKFVYHGTSKLAHGSYFYNLYNEIIKEKKRKIYTSKKGKKIREV